MPCWARSRPFEPALRGLLRTFGLRVGAISRGRLRARIRDPATGNPMFLAATEPMLRARASRRQELADLERRGRQPAQDDPVCHRLMSMPGIGAVPPGRGGSHPVHILEEGRALGRPDAPAQPVRRARRVGRDRPGAGDVTLRRALCQAATVMMHRGRATWLGTWAAQVARRRGRRRAMVALAQRIGLILLRMWRGGTVVRTAPPVTAHAAQAHGALSVARLTAGLRGPPGDAVPTMPWPELLPTDRRAPPMGSAGRNCIAKDPCWQPAR